MHCARPGKIHTESATSSQTGYTIYNKHVCVCIVTHTIQHRDLLTSVKLTGDQAITIMSTNTDAGHKRPARLLLTTQLISSAIFSTQPSMYYTTPPNVHAWSHKQITFGKQLRCLTSEASLVTEQPNILRYRNIWLTYRMLEALTMDTYALNIHDCTIVHTDI